MSHYHFYELGSSSSYLTSYPYLLSGPLHTYAGLLSFYLAQPPSNLAKNASTSTTLTPRNHIDGTQPGEINSAQSVSSRSDTSTVRPSTKSMEPPNPILIRQARAYFVKALAIDESDVVAGEFIENVSDDINHC
jgi:RNA polymerase I-specific transcription initiation factor RRN11